MSDFDVFNPILLFLILDEAVIFIHIPTVLVLGESFSYVLEVL